MYLKSKISSLLCFSLLLLYIAIPTPAVQLSPGTNGDRLRLRYSLQHGFANVVSLCTGESPPPRLPPLQRSLSPI